MFKLVRRGIAANLGRLLLTLASVFVGVAFVSGSFVLADSLRAVFGQVSEDIFAGVDAQVQAVEPEISSGFDLPRFDGSLAEDVQALDEVEYAEGGLFAFEQTYTLNAEGEVNRPLGPPVFTSSWGGPSPVSAFTLLDGEAPAGQEIAIDQLQADTAGFEIGDTIMVALPTGQPEEFTLSGLIDFGEGGAAGAYFNLFDLETTQRILGLEGQVDSIVVAAVPGTDSDDLLVALEAVIPEGLEARSADDVIADQEEEFGTVVDLIGNVLLGFAIVVLFVSIFIIYNTFAILVGQRTRQLGLLRSIGASARQVRTIMLVEAAIVGLLASVAGLFGGIGVAWLLKQLFSTAGGAFPDGPLEIRPRTIYVVIVVGLLVTLASALIPAVRASRVSPLEAVREGGHKERTMLFRVVSGGAVILPGLVLLAFGLFADIDGTAERLAAIGVGGGLSFLGVSMLSALFAEPLAEVLGYPIERLKGVTGRLARENASRHPQRTATTATALMIGLALISGVAVLTSSLLRTFDQLLEEAIVADLFVFEENQGLPFPAVTVDELSQLPEVETVAGFTNIEARIAGDVSGVAAYETATGIEVVNIGVSEGTMDLGTDGIAVLGDQAEELGLGLGDAVEVEFEDGFVTDLTVEAVYQEDGFIGAPFVVDRAVSSEHVATDTVNFVGVNLAEDVEAGQARAAVEAAVADVAQVGVQDNSEFRAEAEEQISQLQIIVIGLLVLCLVVAFFGIVNTMALSVLERIREIGLLRAVGMTRQQLRASVRWEAVIVAVFGSLLGIMMGVLLGFATVTAVPDITGLAIPWSQLALYLVVGAILGVIAAYFPAARAARLNILDAIAHE